MTNFGDEGILEEGRTKHCAFGGLNVWIVSIVSTTAYSTS